MPGMFDEWDAKRERTTRPVDPTPAPPRTTEWLGRAQRYARAALDGEVANIIAVPIGSGRNDQLNKSAIKLGHYVAAGAIDERTVYETLGAADGGLDYEATYKTIRSGVEAGKATPAHIPDPTPVKTLADRPPWEAPSANTSNASDDPLDDNYAPRAAAGTATTTGASTAGTLTGTSSPGAVTDAATTTSSTPGHASTSPAATGYPASTIDSSEPWNGSAGTTSASLPPDPAADPAHLAYVAAKTSELRIRRDAMRQLDHEDALRDFRVPPFLDTLADELLLPDVPVSYAVDELFPTGANVLLTAQYKTGKTTTVNNLARSFVDGVPFLGRYGMTPIDGRVAVFNYEVDRDQYRRWMRDAGILNADRIAVLNLRGYRMPLDVPYVETWVVEWLKRAEARVWIVDPFARAATGVDENSNTEVGTWLDTLDVIKGRAGVSELVLPTHTGRAEMEVGQERSRGATRLEDWTDVRWLLTKDKSDVRYFRATGRDVEVDEGALAYDEGTRLLTMTGGNRRTNDEGRVEAAIALVLTNVAGQSGEGIEEGVRQHLGTASNSAVRSALKRMIAAGRIRVDKQGSRNSHYLLGPHADPLAS